MPGFESQDVPSDDAEPDLSGGSFPERVRCWTIHHFTISDSEPHVSRLLRKVADSIDKLGDVEVFDITFCAEIGGATPEIRMTTYVSFPGEE